MLEEKPDYLDNYDELVNIIMGETEIDGKNFSLKEDYEKFFIKGNKAAGARVRKVMQKIRRLAEKIRKDVQEYKNEI